MTARLAGAGGRLNRLRKGASTLRRSKAPISAPRRHNLVLLDRHRVEEDLLEAADAALLHEAAKLGDRHPLLLATVAATTTTTAAVATATAATAVTAITAATATAKSTTFAFGHLKV